MINSQRKAWILDVGHGNSTVVRDSDRVSIIDGGQKGTLIRFLEEQKIERIETVVVSHADADHFSGILLLLRNSNFDVGQVFLNPDSRDTALWRDFRTEMESLRQHGVEFKIELNSINPGTLSQGNTSLEILAPLQEDAINTIHGQSIEGAKLNPNRMSAVVRVWVDDTPKILLPGDIDYVMLESLIEKNTDLRADVLVFPHHGGKPMPATPRNFVHSFLNAVSPKLVVFSIGRGRYSTPRPEFVSAVLSYPEEIHIACTQLSERCAQVLPGQHPYLYTATSQGASSNACCAGTIEVLLEEQLRYVPRREDHLDFVDRFAPTALCRIRSATK